MREPIQLALAGDCAIIRAGLSSMLATYPEVEVVVQDSFTTVNADVLLYDPFLQRPVQFESWSVPRTVSGTKKILYTWVRDPRAIAFALGGDGHGYLFKGTSAEELVCSIKAAHQGDFSGVSINATLLIRTEGLTPREADLLNLIAQGISNEEIARKLSLSVNSIKSCIRGLYRKIGVETRAQAVIWALTAETSNL